MQINQKVVNKIYYWSYFGMTASVILMFIHIAAVITFETICGSVEYRDTLGAIVGVGLLVPTFIFYIIVEAIDVKKAEKESPEE